MMRLPLAGLGLLFLVLGALLYGALAGYAYFDLGRVDAELRAREQALAHEEIEDSVRGVLERARARLQALGEWDEARQQLGTDAYYDYWRAERLPTRALPSWVAGVELYRDGGQALGQALAAPFVHDLEPFDQRPLLVREAGRDFLLLATAVTAPGGGAPRGHLVLAVDLAAALIPPGGFRYATLDSRITTLPESARVFSSDVSNKIRYRARPGQGAATYAAFMHRLFVQVAVVTATLLLLTFLALMWLVRNPLRRLAGSIDALGEQPEDEPRGGILSPFLVDELDRLRRSLTEHQSRLEVVHRGLDRKNRRLWKLAHHDSLTGCLNRRAFEDDWRHILELAAQRPAQVSLILIDCNHFRAINETYGHNVGDEVLKGMALTVQRGLRRSDRLYRVAGDEFAVIFVDAGEGHANLVAQESLQAIDRHGFTQLGMREPVRISIGIAHSVGGEPDDLKTLYRRANVAMFHAKRPGHPRLAVYRAQMEGSADAALSSRAANAVDRAIASGDNLFMNYQPVVSLSDREPVYYEALVRLQAGEGPINPEEFFLQVETRHLEAEFDQAIFDTLLRELAAGTIPQGRGLSINISGASVVAPDIEQRLHPFAQYLDRHDLLLEVTETTLISQLQLASETLVRLRTLGFRIALDDFGSGYSSLRYLADMPVDVVKFDISLVRALCEDTPRGRMLAKLVGLLKEPGFVLVAEGVESEDMARTVAGLGFDYAQGFMLGRPRPGAEISPPGR